MNVRVGAIISFRFAVNFSIDQIHLGHLSPHVMRVGLL